MSRFPQCRQRHGNHAEGIKPVVHEVEVVSFWVRSSSSARLGKRRHVVSYWSIRRAAAGLSNHTQEAPTVNLTQLKASQARHQRQGTHEVEEVAKIATMSAQGEPLSPIPVDKKF